MTESLLAVSADVGGTFTDIAVRMPDGRMISAKAPTRPEAPAEGVLAALEVAAEKVGPALPHGLRGAEGLLASTGIFIYSSTHAINAVLTGATAKTALLVTQGHPDVLMFREGGRRDPFRPRPFPAPFIPRALVREVPERIGPDGHVSITLDEDRVVDILRDLAADGVEAVAVGLLWSPLNPVHELRIGALIEQHLPGVPYTLSHRLNPVLREYRRLSSACLDAALKPLMGRHFAGLETRLRGLGLKGRLFCATSQGGFVSIEDAANAPVHTLFSGPSMAPVAARGMADPDDDSLIIMDIGGTSCDVSLVNRGRIPWSREAWLGEPFHSWMIGFPSVDVRSIGAGGGSIAHVDDAGMLHVGPDSASSVPGPACYGRGGDRPTMTDACLVLGLLAPDTFLGGRITLDVEAAREAVRRDVAEPLGVSVEAAAQAVIDVFVEKIAGEIEDVTIGQGIDPAEATLVAGGGAAGFVAVPVATRLGCRDVLFPPQAPVLSAVGALEADLKAVFTGVLFTVSDAFDGPGAAGLLKSLWDKAEAWLAENSGHDGAVIEPFVQARYPGQVWDLEVPLRDAAVDASGAVAALVDGFHALHERLFCTHNPSERVEFVSWGVHVACRMAPAVGTSAAIEGAALAAGTRVVRTADGGTLTAGLWHDLAPGARLAGPALIESALTTVWLPPGCSGAVGASGGVRITPGDRGAALAATETARLAVVANRMQLVTRKMQNTLFRTARSGVINSAHDCSCALLTGDARLINVADSLPIHVMAGPDLMAQSMLDLHDDLRPGDAFLHNSPYHGNSHPADLSILVPVFDDEGRHRFTVLAKAHQADIGNAEPTTYAATARDVYAEGGMLFPCMRVQTAYQDNADLIRMCRMRIRVPDQWYADYLALLGAARVGEQEIAALAREVGWDALDDLVDAWFDYSDRRMGSVIARLPTATARARSTHDPFPGIPEGVTVTATVSADCDARRIRVDLTENRDCVPCGLNLSEGCARTAALIGVFNGLGEAVPANAGSFSRIDIALRENCVVGIPRHPVSCSVATTNISDRVINAVQRAMADFGTGVGMAEAGAVIPPAGGVISGVDEHGRPFVNKVLLGITGGPAGPHADGWLTAMHAGSIGMCRHDSIEVAELKYPIRVHARRLLADTGGAGTLCGAPSAYVEFGPVGTAGMDIMYAADATINAPLGARGGLAGGAAACRKRRVDGVVEDVAVTGRVSIAAGETIISVSPGGGGFGPPGHRDPGVVAHDVREGYYTVETAQAVFGVALTAAGAVDEAATAVLRRR